MIVQGRELSLGATDQFPCLEIVQKILRRNKLQTLINDNQIQYGFPKSLPFVFLGAS